MAEYAVVDPATGVKLAQFPLHDDEQIADAIAAAHRAYQGWARTTSVADRAHRVRRVAQLHLERREELAAAMVREMGKPLDEALAEVGFSADIYFYYAKNAENFLSDEVVPIQDGSGSALIRREPLGVLLGIMPWNFPCYQVARFAAPNLAGGNTILLKHAPQCPESASLLEEIFHEADFPTGAYVNIFAANEQIETVLADARVRGVSLTGSERAGAAVAEIAGRHLKKVVLELGGSDPFILLSTDDLDGAVAAGVAARLGNGGQACNAAKRFLVHEALYDDFLTRFTDRMLLEPARPLSSLAAAEQLEQQIAEAVAQGATYVTASSRKGATFPPGVLTGVARDNAVYFEEIFGPVAVVHRVSDETEAITLANDSPFGLGSYVFTTDPGQAQRIADQLEAGMVFVNGVSVEGPELPFGGIKRSGFGRELGRFGIDEFVNKKLIRVVR